MIIRESAQRRRWIVAVLSVLVTVLAGCSTVRSWVGLPPDLGDVDSNQDLSGRTATVSSADSPYTDLLPSVCQRIPDSFFTERGLEAPSGPAGDFFGPLLSLCTAHFPRPFDPKGWGLTIGIYADPIASFKSTSIMQVVQENIKVGPDIATMFRESRDPLTCSVMWGTFYGSAGVTVNLNDGNPTDPCRDIVELARAVHQYLPTRPTEMRPAS